MTELPANPAKRIISLLRHIAAARRSRSGAPGRAVRLRWARRAAAVTGSSRSGAEQGRPCGRAARPRTWPEGQYSPGPHSAPPPPAHLACSDVLSPVLQKRGSALLGPVQPLAGRVAVGCSVAPATQIHSSHAEGVDKCGKVPREAERCAAAA